MSYKNYGTTKYTVEQVKEIIQKDLEKLSFTITSQLTPLVENGSLNEFDIIPNIHAPRLDIGKEGFGFLRISMRTPPIDLETKKRSYHLGNLTIRLDIVSNVRGKCKYWELIITHPTRHTAHPHVYGHMDVCLGNYEDYVSGEIEKRNFDTVYLLLVNFLRTYNPGQYYRSPGGIGAPYTVKELS